MIKVVGVSKGYGNQTLFEDVGFQIHKKERLGLLGRNGYGKSTLLKIIAGQEEPDSGEIISPKFYKVGVLDQHLLFSFDSIIEEVCSALGAAADEKRWQAEMVLSGLGFTESDFVRSPAEFSGGYQIRIQLAKLLVAECDLLLLDEPTNYLDIVALRWLERFLQRWSGELLLITHDRDFLDAVCTGTLIIHRQQVKKFPGDSAAAYNQIETEESVHTQTMHALQKKQQKTEQFIRKFRAGARSAGLVQSRIKMLEKQKIPQKLEKIPEIRFRFDTLPFYAGVMIGGHNIVFGYDQKTPPLIDKCTLNLTPGDKIAIIGRNGAGKSTLLKLLAGQLQPNSGSIKLKTDLEVGYFAQSNTNSLNPNATILEELSGISPTAREQDIRTICASLLFTGEAVHKPIKVLSGGEKSRVGFAKLLLKPAHVLLLDEPTNHFDMESCDALGNALTHFKGAVVIVSHNENILKQVANKLVVFENSSQKVYETGYQTFLDEIGWQDEVDELAQIKTHETNPLKQNTLKREGRKQLQRILRQTERKISDFEQKLEQLEQQNLENTKALQIAASENDHLKIRQFSELASDLHKQIEKGYSTLDQLLETQAQTQHELSEDLS
jgi:ATP-binding cassette subfamily F protein 3